MNFSKVEQVHVSEHKCLPVTRLNNSMSIIQMTIVVIIKTVIIQAITPGI